MFFTVLKIGSASAFAIGTGYYAKTFLVEEHVEKIKSFYSKENQGNKKAVMLKFKDTMYESYKTISLQNSIDEVQNYLLTSDENINTKIKDHMYNLYKKISQQMSKDRLQKLICFEREPKRNIFDYRDYVFDQYRKTSLKKSIKQVQIFVMNEEESKQRMKKMLKSKDRMYESYKKLSLKKSMDQVLDYIQTLGDGNHEIEKFRATLDRLNEENTKGCKIIAIGNNQTSTQIVQGMREADFLPGTPLLKEHKSHRT